MYLKSIEMQGFKSFPDRTKLVFDPGRSGSDKVLTIDGERAVSDTGVTVIVGPNGSGKSNIADAMRWVLGEISSKTLRGSKMEDVIFGGADSRRPMGYAEVSVTFDNTSDFGKLDCPYDEVTVTRRYFRSGESEYLINRKSVRLKDIYELFLNTGIGRDGYSIIGQGRITEMVSRKSEERRSIFEDASGIAKYRMKKNEAERKLAATENNLVRIRDIFAEVESQVGPLEREAAKAKRGIALLETKKRADVSLWLYDTERLGGEIEEATNTFRHAEFDLRQAEDNLQALDVQNQRLTEMSQGSRQTSEELRARITELTDAQHTLDSEYRVTETNMAHTEELIASAGENRAALLRQLEGDRAQLAAHTARVSELQGTLDSLDGEQTKNAAEIAELNRKIAALNDKITISGEEIHRREQELVDIKVRISVLENARNSDSDRNSGILTEMEQYESTSRELEDKVSACKRSVERYTEAHDRTVADLSAAEGKLAELNDEYGKQYEALNTEKLRRDSTRQRIQNFRAMEEHFEGYANAVRFVMNQYKEGKITGFGGEPCGTVYGPLSKVIAVDDPYITAVETALGANLQHIVVEDEATAKAAMYALKRGQAGRATFFPLTSMRGQTETPEMKQAAGFAGYVAVADSLVSCDDRFRNVVSSLLGRTVIFDNIDHATAMAKSLRYRVRVVTLDGQQINVGGSFTGGSVNQKNGVLTRAGEIKRLEEELVGLNARVEQSERTLAEIRERIKEADEEKGSLEDKRDLTRVLLGNEAARLEQAQAQFDANATLLDRMKADCEQILRSREQYEGDMEALRAEETAEAQALSELRAFREDQAAQRGDAEDRVDQLTSEQTRLFIAISAARKDVETEETLAHACRERMAACENDIRVSDDRVVAYRQKLADYATAQTENRRLYAEGELKLATLTDDRQRVDENNADYEARLSALAEKIRAQMNHKEALFRAHTTAEAKLTALQAEMDKLSGRLWDDYGMSRADAVILGYPEITPENHKETVALQTECRNKLRAIGHFDPEAVEKYNEVKERYETMSVQLADLEKSKTELTGIITGLEGEMKTAFVTAFNQINENFRETFAELFGGGSAEITLTDPENVLESGIEIKAAPPGKIIKSLMQLSGGEQAFIGVALFFAVLKVNPSPFCILDEIEAALDEVNVERLAQYIKRYSDETQFIMITHRRGTMAAANRLYGVTMPERGISKVLALDVADISKNKENDWNGLFN